MIDSPHTIDELLDYWPGNIPFKGSLVSDDGSCMCAQGQALHFLGNLTIDELRNIRQVTADRQVAKLLNISVAHSILLRIVNDKPKGAPSSVIRNPEQVLGDQAQIVLAFWRQLDCMTPAAWQVVKTAISVAARTEAGTEAETAALEAALEAAETEALGATLEEALEAARTAAWTAAGTAAGDAAGDAAAWASNEIQCAAAMRAKGLPFYFLPMFGISDPEELTEPAIAAGWDPEVLDAADPNFQTRTIA